jgi:uncharacterized protein YndB with AHSA1/START domain
MSKPEFVYTTYIKTTPEKLWHALTDRDFTRRYWMDCTLTSDWKAGSPHDHGARRRGQERVRDPGIRSAAQAVL